MNVNKSQLLADSKATFSQKLAPSITMNLETSSHGDLLPAMPAMKVGTHTGLLWPYYTMH